MSFAGGTMIRLCLAGLALLTCGTAARACQCQNPATLSAKDVEQGARWMIEQKMVIAEVVRVGRTGLIGPGVYKVIRPIVGSAPPEIRIAYPSRRLSDGTVVQRVTTSCDYAPPVGVRRIMAFALEPRNAPGPAHPRAISLRNAAQQQLVPANSCTQLLLAAPGMIERIRRLHAAKAKL